MGFSCPDVVNKESVEYYRGIIVENILQTIKDGGQNGVQSIRTMNGIL